MKKVSANEFQRNIGLYQDMALMEPLSVTRNGRSSTVMISVREYERLKTLEARSVIDTHTSGENVQVRRLDAR
jgi:PHD/YefM family antitoxin component YafN of YafNO toxin-antitoxin module